MLTSRARHRRVQVEMQWRARRLNASGAALPLARLAATPTRADAPSDALGVQLGWHKAPVGGGWRVQGQHPRCIGCQRVLRALLWFPDICERWASIVLGSRGSTMRDAVRNKEGEKGAVRLPKILVLRIHAWAGSPVVSSRRRGKRGVDGLCGGDANDSVAATVTASTRRSTGWL